MERTYFRRLNRIYEAITSVISPHHSDSTSEEDQPQPQYRHHYRECEDPALLQTSPRDNELVSLEYDPCLSCADPCSSHSNYPSYLKIDYRSPLEGTVKPYVKHVLISTGKSDWSSYIEDESNTLAAHLHRAIKSDKVPLPKLVNNKRDPSRKEKKNNKVEGSPPPQQQLLLLQQEQKELTEKKAEKEPAEDEQQEKPRIVITNSSRLNTDSNDKGNDVLLFPDNILIRDVTLKQASEFYKKFLSSYGNMVDEKELNNNNINFTVGPMPYKAVIVICSHKRRDKRCGITGPLLKDEFDKVLKEKGLDVESHRNEGVAVFLSSHTGGNLIFNLI